MIAPTFLLRTGPIPLSLIYTSHGGWFPTAGVMEIYHTSSNPISYTEEFVTRGYPLFHRIISAIETLMPVIESIHLKADHAVGMKKLTSALMQEEIFGTWPQFHTKHWDSAWRDIIYKSLIYTPYGPQSTQSQWLQCVYNVAENNMTALTAKSEIGTSGREVMGATTTHQIRQWPKTSAQLATTLEEGIQRSLTIWIAPLQGVMLQIAMADTPVTLADRCELQRLRWSMKIEPKGQKMSADTAL